MQNFEDMEFYPAALTISRSDASGGAGIQADLRTFNAFGIYGCTAITAVAEKTLTANAVQSQLESVLDAIPVRIAKCGFAGDDSIAGVIADIVCERKLPLIVDPVIFSAADARLPEKLFPLAAWITPDVQTAELILGRKLEGRKALAEAAGTFYDRYGCNVVLRSSYASAGKAVTDFVCCDGKLFTLSSPAVKVTEKTLHGAGCTFSAALTAGLAFGMNWDQAVTEAKSFVYGSLCEAVHLSGNVVRMYPPSEDSLGRIRLEAWKDKN